ncbi:LysR family transcriptional regulator [Roseiarcus fermentans]|uniref:LysR family transcriptional regulator n=1 Tax=Roseiarcus fermentans TaxID=1473586 RepID=A0A366FGK2_9HYPH|nr:LysR family transcriptional regulator [Roseiarcus fermentans]RBP12855.1 LysR family transcriptional regulator [Roseiarcus fermentans]
MIDLDAMATFVAVVRSGHFAAASRALGLPRSTVSQRVARLEAALGVRLLERTTRVLRPTSAGAAYYERCARILAELEEATVAIRDLATSPRGILRVATSHLLGQSVVAAVAAAFSRRYPEVEVEVVASDRRVNLLEEGFDVAVVVSASEMDSTLISRVLSGGRTWCCAAPSYLSARGAPLAPRDVSAHDCVIREAAADGFASGAMWIFERGGDVQRVEARGRLRLSSIMMAQAAALAGAGIAAIPSFLCAEDVENGRLVRVLSDWDVDRKDIRIVYPSHRHLSPRVRLFIDALVAAAAEDGRLSAPQDRGHLGIFPK